MSKPELALEITDLSFRFGNKVALDDVSFSVGMGQFKVLLGPNGAGIMNFVIFPMFFLSSALYPLWKMRESSYFLYQLCTFNPFTYAVELTRFALYEQANPEAAVYTLLALTVFLGAAIYAYDPARGIMTRKGTTGG